MEITKENNVGELVAEDYRFASIFENHGIDFCCNGNRSINDACANKNVDAEKVISELKEAAASFPKNGGQDFNSWPLDLLADYIVKRHHKYAEEKITEIKPYLAKIVQVHGMNHPELAQVEELFQQTAGEVAKHMKKEELMLFPFIKKMAKAKEENQPIPKKMGSSLEDSLKQLESEHDDQGEGFRQMAELTNNFTTPADGCTTYNITLQMLKEFEADLHQHIHLENNILFPKAVKMEQGK